MQIDRVKIIKNAILVIVSIIVILLLVLGVLNSSFNKLKKYDIETKISKDNFFSRAVSSSLSNSMEVTIISATEANLGDFVFNISGKEKLIANISIKYKLTNKSSSWLNGNSDAKDEILKKGVILRDATINAMLGYSSANINSEKMRKKIKNILNNNLSNTEVEEVYFNQFIVQ
ncbi:flagellar basal body-associated FliL family protein [Sulfurimonas sp.]|jgi:flagellar basal body-associated protein FliL|uniref:flagellar basal body-associated FliL family protein n=1 Tax=Sulfurimonas sp. TaxID=2022749 RepID=UPI0025D8FCAE|nr:flagellar basal body-associated FliL family protein [Sulfurimonas sp.]MCK9472819.1 flagellar basal body-associated FliL family protein [Sulfurimonas sp.]